MNESTYPTQYDANSYQRTYKEDLQYEKQADDLTQVISEIQENINIIRTQGDNLENEIKQIKIDVDRSNEGAGYTKNITLALAGSCFLTVFLIYCFKPMIDAALNTTKT